MSEKKDWKIGEQVKMHCWSCLKETTFEVIDPEEGPVCECGHYQESKSQGAAELCKMATWYDLNAYAEMAAIARDGGHDVPETPRYYRDNA